MQRACGDGRRCRSVPASGKVKRNPMARYVLFLTLAATRILSAQATLPTEWIDPDTGHRVIRLSREDGTLSLYFNQNAYTADGKKLIVTTADGGIATIDLATREVRRLVAGPVSVLAAGRKTGDVYYTKRAPARPDQRGLPNRNSNGAIVYATNVDTGATREVVKLPPGRNVASLNADETLLLGTYVDGAATTPHRRPARLPGINQRFGQPDYASVGADGKPMTFADAKDLRLHDALMAARAGAPRVLFTVNTTTGELKEILREREWLGHLQFSPSDANLILFCHEGTWHEVDRDLDDPRRRRRPDQDPHPNDEYGNRRPRVFRGGWRHDLVRPANTARPGFLAGRLQGSHGQAHLVSPRAQRMVGALQRFGRRHTVCRRWRRQRNGGTRARWQMDLSVPARTRPGRGRHQDRLFRTT